MQPASKAPVEQAILPQGNNGAASMKPGPILFLGPPGAGKGTQAREIARGLGIPHISTGDMFRENVEKQTEIGRLVKAILETGDLVGDDLVNEMVRNRLSNGDCGSGFILDGYPRTIAQADALKDYLRQTGQSAPIVVDLQVSYDVIVRRLSGRRVCPRCNRVYNLHSHPPASDSICDDDRTPLQQRPDDREEAIRERLATYKARTAPLIAYYRREGRFHEIDAGRSPEQITAALSGLLQVP